MAILRTVKEVFVPSMGALPLKDGETTFNTGGISREHQPGQNPQDGGFLEKQVGAKLDVTLNNLPGLDIEALNSISEEDITVKLADGTVYVMPKAAVENPPEMSQGDVKAVFISNRTEKL